MRAAWNGPGIGCEADVAAVVVGGEGVDVQRDKGRMGRGGGRFARV